MLENQTPVARIASPAEQTGSRHGSEWPTQEQGADSDSLLGPGWDGFQTAPLNRIPRARTQHNICQASPAKSVVLLLQP